MNSNPSVARSEVSAPPRRPMAIRTLIGRIWLAFFGWRVDGAAPAVRKAVVVAAPHTTGWDLPFTLGVSWVLGLRIYWVGKHTLFSKTWGWFFRALGGLPVNRSGGKNSVQATAEVLKAADDLLIIIAPEGTRKQATRWKTGFYYIALEAKVPIVLGFLDYSRQAGGFGHVFWPTGDIRADFEAIRKFYEPVKGKFPELQSMITLGEDEAPELQRANG